MTYSNAIRAPSSPSGVVVAKRCGGSHAVIVASRLKPPRSVRTAPPRRGSTLLVPMNQASRPRPVVIASQTSSGEAATSISARTSNGWAMSGVLPACLPARGGAGVDGDDHAMVASPVCPAVVVLGDEPGYGFRNLLGKSRSVRGRGKPDRSVEGERRHPLPGLQAASNQDADVADEPAGDGQQPERRQAIWGSRRIRLNRSEGRRRDHVGRGRRPQDALGHVALSALLDELDQPVPLERPEVVVHLLTRKPHARRKGRCRARLGELCEEPAPNRVERDLGGGGVLDDCDVQHPRYPLTDN